MRAIFGLLFASLIAFPGSAMTWRVETAEHQRSFEAVVSSGDPDFHLSCAGGPEPGSLNYVFVLDLAPELFDGPLPDIRADVMVAVDDDGFLLPHLELEMDGDRYRQRLSMADPLFMALRTGKEIRLMLPDGTEVRRSLEGMSETLAAAMAFCRNRLLARGVSPPADLIPLYNSTGPIGRGE